MPDQSWVGTADNETIAASLAVIQDIQRELGLSPAFIVIPLAPTVPRFPELMQDRTPESVGKYVDLRWKAAQLLERDGAITHLELLTASPVEESSLKIQVDEAAVSRAAHLLGREYWWRHSSLNTGRHATDSAESETADLSVASSITILLHGVGSHESHEMLEAAELGILADGGLRVQTCDYTNATGIPVPREKPKNLDRCMGLLLRRSASGHSLGNPCLRVRDEIGEIHYVIPLKWSDSHSRLASIPLALSWLLVPLLCVAMAGAYFLAKRQGSLAVWALLGVVALLGKGFLGHDFTVSQMMGGVIGGVIALLLSPFLWIFIMPLFLFFLFPVSWNLVRTSLHAATLRWRFALIGLTVSLILSLAGAAAWASWTVWYLRGAAGIPFLISAALGVSLYLCRAFLVPDIANDIAWYIGDGLGHFTAFTANAG